MKIADSFRVACFRWGTALAATGVLLGALGAHALKDVLDAGQLDAFQTAVRYQLIHAVGLLALGAVPQQLLPSAVVRRSLAWGTVLFSGSIYVLLALPESVGWMRSVVGPVTPLGGIALIFGWCWWFISLLREKGVR